MRLIEAQDLQIIKDFFESGSENSIFDLRTARHAPYTHLQEEYSDGVADGLYSVRKCNCLRKNMTRRLMIDHMRIDTISLNQLTFGQSKTFEILIFLIGHQDDIAKYKNIDAQKWPTGYEIVCNELQFYGIYDVENVKPFGHFLDFSFTKIAV